MALSSPCNPLIHHRRSVRLKGYDYAQAGGYFITICCKDMECRFGAIVNNEMVLNEYGIIAYNEWAKLFERFSNCELDVFQIMPNHMHGILVLTDARENPALRNEGNSSQNTNNPQIVGAGLVPALHNEENTQHNHNNVVPSRVRAGINPAPAIGNIVGTYKSLVANKCLDAAIANRPGNDTAYIKKIWHRNYFEHIIRNEKAYHNIAEYIINNPAKWQSDKFYR